MSAAGINAVKEVSKQLTAIPGKRYQVEGHTDNVPIATAVFPSNWELASARAITVMKSMIDAGMPANRRIAIVVVPDLSTLPGYEELQKLSQ